MDKSTWYRIHIQGHLDAQWADWFEHMTLIQNTGGTTTLEGPVADQPALYGLLDKLRDLGMQLISVQRRGTDMDMGDIDQLQREKEFITHWLSDLLATMAEELDRGTQLRLIEGCGRGCFYRFSFKQEIAQEGQGNLDRLLAAYRRNFEAWREGDRVHIRYGEVSPGCYCPAARAIPPRPDDLHCECTRTTHQTIFETALGHPVRMEILESVRRGGRTCHFVAHVGDSTDEANTGS
jgi:hypothetical protein